MIFYNNIHTVFLTTTRSRPSKCVCVYVYVCELGWGITLLQRLYSKKNHVISSLKTND